MLCSNQTNYLLLSAETDNIRLTVSLGTNKKSSMKYHIEPFNQKDIDELYALIITTIKRSYAELYPAEAIDYFITKHTKETILTESKTGNNIVIKNNNRIVATGTIIASHIKRVFITPEFQGKGYGKAITHALEQYAINNGIKLIELHSSLAAKKFYDELDYHTFTYAEVAVANNKKLGYYRMVKSLLPENPVTQWDLANKTFKVLKNDGDGAEVNEQTRFYFKQQQNLLYAEFLGGEVRYGEFFGVILNDSIYFYYEQENLEGGKNRGSSIDKITYLDNGKIQLLDKWQWQTRPGTGVCILEEL